MTPDDAGADSAIDAAIDASDDDDDAGLDPDVRFDWTETLPGQGMCIPGHYVGSFSCTVNQPPGPPTPFAGQMTFDLAGAAESNLTIENGMLSDVAAALFTAKVDGSLDCVTDRFSAVTHEGGTTLLGSVLFNIHRFEARLSGDFDEDSQELHGDFAMTNDLGQVCRGTFEAAVAP